MSKYGWITFAICMPVMLALMIYSDSSGGLNGFAELAGMAGYLIFGGWVVLLVNGIFDKEN